jgi:Rieske Fe-S protein
MSVTRRIFVRCSLATGAALAGGVIGCGNDVTPPATADIPVRNDGKLSLDFAQFPTLATSGSALTLRLVGGARSLPPAILVVHRAAPDDPYQYVATTSACPHLGCPLGYSPREDLIECPCHASRFRAAPTADVPDSCVGDVVHGPAQQGPRAYRVTQLRADILEIDLNGRLDCREPTLQPPPRVVDGKVVLAIADYPALAAVGGAIVIERVDGFADPIAVSRSGPGTAVAVDASCTHACCRVEPLGQEWLCPCHGSTFALDGRVTGGPARFDLPRFDAQVVGETIVISMLQVETMNDCARAALDPDQASSYRRGRRA